jgi:hypothetical protein
MFHKNTRKELSNAEMSDIIEEEQLRLACQSMEEDKHYEAIAAFQKLK